MLKWTSIENEIPTEEGLYLIQQPASLLPRLTYLVITKDNLRFLSSHDSCIEFLNVTRWIKLPEIYA